MAPASSSGQEGAKPPKPDSSPSEGERRKAEGGSGNESTEIEGGECPPVRADWFLQLEEPLEQRGGQVSKPVTVNVPGAKPEVYTGHPPGMARGQGDRHAHGQGAVARDQRPRLRSGPPGPRRARRAQRGETREGLNRAARDGPDTRRMAETAAAPGRSLGAAARNHETVSTISPRSGKAPATMVRGAA